MRRSTTVKYVVLFYNSSLMSNVKMSKTITQNQTLNKPHFDMQDELSHAFTCHRDVKCKLIIYILLVIINELRFLEW